MDFIYKSFEVPIMKSIMDVDENYSQRCIEEIYKVGDEFEKKTNVKASMSDYYLHFQSRVFDNLIESLTSYIYENFPYRLFINEEAGKTKEDHFLCLDNFWSAIYKEGDYTIRHHHGESDISFCFYLQSNKKSSPLFFEDIDLKINPEKNLLIAFPSFLNHSVEKQIKNKKDRIILSGNLTYKYRKGEFIKVKKNY